MSQILLHSLNTLSYFYSCQNLGFCEEFHKNQRKRGKIDDAIKIVENHFANKWSYCTRILSQIVCLQLLPQENLVL